MNFLGVDPGVHGGLAMVNDAGIGTLLDAIDIPII